MNEKIDNPEYTGLEVAVTGMACHFPDARSPEEYWQNLMNGKESVRFFSEKEVIASGVTEDVCRSPGYVKSNGALLEGKYNFDPEFFGYSLDEAVLLDPQIRLLHECVYAALEDAGCVPGKYKGRIGLYAGASSSMFWEVVAGFSESASRIGPWATHHLTSKDYIGTLIAYKLGLNGPGITIDTACSTSLVAVHMAARAILLGECDTAVAGGSSVMNIVKKGYLFEEGLIRSPDGHCRAFDKDAKGTVAGEGAGAVVLKSLKKAIADGDHIYAVIKGSAVNNDGARKVGFSAPGSKGQTEVITEALRFAAVEPGTIGYVEMHGTGTQIGDPIEIRALTAAYSSKGSRLQSCAIGSVKANIGHLDAAAGIAGFIKAVMALKKKALPPSINYVAPNPACDFEHSPLYVNTQPKAWENQEYPRRAAVSSFGIGGTNAHVVLEEFTATGNKFPEPGDLADSGEPLLFVLSAKTTGSLEQTLEAYQKFLQNEEQVNLHDMAYTLQMAREHYACRKYMVFAGQNELREGITGGRLKEATGLQRKEIVFVFTGQGSQYAKMGLGLYKTYGLFAKELDYCFAICKQLTGKDLKQMLFGPDDSQINHTIYAQPLLFALQYSLARLLDSWGIKPVAMIGHSVGEFVCACVSGLFTLEEGLTLIVKRGMHMQDMQEGKMLGINMGWKELIGMLPEGVVITSVNSPGHCVAGGEKQQIEKLQSLLAAKGINSGILATSHAFHSPMMEEAAKRMENEFRQIRFRGLQIPYISNVTGRWADEVVVTQPAYWAKHLRDAVQLEKGLGTLLENEKAVFVVLGPEGAFESFIKNNEKYSSHPVISLLRHPRNGEADDCYYLMDKIGQLWLNGIEPDWSALYANGKRKKVSLPSYRFTHKEFAFDPNILQRLGNGKVYTARDIKKPVADWFLAPIWKRDYARNTGKIPEGFWIIIGGPDAVHKEVLKRIGKTSHHVISLVEADGCFRVGDTSQIIPYTDAARLAAFLKSRELTGALQVVDLSMLGNRWPAEDPMGHLLVLSQALLQLAHLTAIWLKVVTDQVYLVTGSEQIKLQHALLPGALKVIPQEIFNVGTQHIDLVVTAIPEEVAHSICSEVLNTVNMPVSALRNNFRWIPDFEQLSGIGNFPLRQFGKEHVFVITGGLGQIGYACAAYFAAFQCRLCIIGRTELDSNTIENDDIGRERDVKRDRLRRLTSMTDSVIYLAADVTDGKMFREAIDLCVRTFGSVTGIIHAAAIIESEFTRCSILQQSIEQLHRQFRPQVEGLFNLREIVAERRIGFVVLASSLASLLGGPGFLGYAAANACVDAFRSSMHQQGDTAWLSVNWDAWNFDAHTETSGAALAITNQEGPAALHKILSYFSAGGQVIVSTHDFTGRWEKWVALDFRKEVPVVTETAAKKQLLSRPALGMSAEAPAGPEEIGLVELWKELFGYDEIGVKDDFFGLGGDSLKALSLLNKIRTKFSRNLSLEQFFANPTIAGLAPLVKEKDSLQFVITRAAVKQFYMASPTQRRQYFLQQMDPGSTLYNQTSVYEVRGALDPEKLTNAFQQLIKRHEIGRTAIRMMDESIVQEVLEEVPMIIVRRETNGMPELEPVLKEFVQPFNLSKPPLIRLGVVAVSTARHLVILDMHHVITDGISHIILLNDLFKMYNDVELPEQKIQYKDYAEWLNDPARKQQLETQRDFWKQRLLGQLPRIAIPMDYPRPRVQRYNGAFLHFRYPAENWVKLRELCMRHNVTPFMAMLAAYNILLSKLSGLKDILVGTPIAGRNNPELKNVVGMFVNTVVLRNFPLANVCFDNFLLTVKESVLKAFDNQDFPFDELVDLLDTERDLSRNPVFDAFISYENFDAKDYTVIEEKRGDLTITACDFENSSSKFDLTLFCKEFNGKMLLGFQYCTDLFKRETIEKFSGYFIKILDQCLNDQTIKLGDIEMLSHVEKDIVLKDFNTTAASFPEDKTLVDLFREQVLRTPAAMAAVYGSRELTYKELDEYSGRLAAYLAQRGVTVGSLVPVCLHRSLEMIISILGIMKAGAAYVPVDPSYADARIRYIVSDTKAEVLLSSRTAVGSIPTLAGIEVIVLDEDVPVYQRYGESAFYIPVAPEYPAYVIYTSGTTGRPKGVINEHKGVVNRLHWGQSYFRLTSDDAVLQKTSFGFDISVWELLWPLLYGSRVVFAETGGERDAVYLKHMIHRYGITTVHFVPSMLPVFLEVIGPGDCEGLKRVLCSGEALLPGHVSQYRLKGLKAALYNLYGPTEAAIEVSCWAVPAAHKEYETISIGNPVFNTSLYILDESGLPVGIGIAGELHIGGVQVARGYLNRPELTAERFIPNPFDMDGSKLYKTGDLCRWQSDGTIVYLARIDDQVKIRGYRIELDEITTVLQQAPGVKQGVILLKDDEIKGKYLVGYVVCESFFDKESAYVYLRSCLPDYMVPALLVEIEEIPFTASGKTDRKKLLSLALPALSSDSYVPARNELELQLVNIWEELLRVKPIGIHDNFFELGGHSLLIMRFVSMAGKRLNREMPVGDVFSFPTIASLSEHLLASQYSRDEFTVTVQ
jgi:iturin family lipopeptide synthetase A